MVNAPMTALAIRRVAPNKLTRECWYFRAGDSVLRLTAYAIERRGKIIEKWSQPVLADRWQAADERPYASGLPRPETIPPDVLADALASAPRPYIYIGYTRYM